MHERHGLETSNSQGLGDALNVCTPKHEFNVELSTTMSVTFSLQIMAILIIVFIKVLKDVQGYLRHNSSSFAGAVNGLSIQMKEAKSNFEK